MSLAMASWRARTEALRSSCGGGSMIEVEVGCGADTSRGPSRRAEA